MNENIVVKIGADVSKLASDLNKATTDIKKFGKATSDSMNGAVKDMRTYEDANGRLRDANGKFLSSAEKTARGLDKVGDNSKTAGDKLNDFGNKAKTAGASMAATFGAATLAIAGGLGFAVKKAADFDTEIRKAGAIAGASAKELDAMKQAALELGATTSESAGSVAVAMTELAAKGFTANEAIAAMPGIISAAEASGEDLALAADTVSSALNIFGLEAADSSRVADILAESANTSAAGIDSLGYVLKYAGAPAAALGISLEEVAAAAGIMADAGIDGSSSGTALRASLLALNNPAKAQAKIMDGLGFSMTDSKGKTKSLSKIVGDLTKSMDGMTEADKVATLAKLVGTEAVSGFLALTKAGPEKIDKMSDSLRNSAGASEEAAEKMKAGIGGALENLSGAFETLSITIGDQLVPYVQSAAKWLANLAEKFTGLSDKTKKFLVVGTAIIGIFAAIGAFLGIALVVVGSGITAFGAVAGAMGVAASATGILGGAFALLTGPFGLALLAVAGVGLAVVGLVKHFKEDAIPEIDRFGEGVSETTKESLGKFFELSDGVSQAMADLSINSGVVTEEMKTNLIGKFGEMNKQIVEGMKTRHAEQLEDMGSFFANSSVLTDEHEAIILNRQKKSNDDQLTAQQEREDRIKKIIETAYAEKRELTTIEEAAINGIKDEMNRAAVKSLSKSEVEQKIILERMAQTAGDLSARQAADVVKNSAKQRDETIKAAEETYDGSIGEIIRLRDETAQITDEQADQMIAEAGKSRDGTVAHAKGMHKEVVAEAQKQAEGHIKAVDWETGEIKSKWTVMITDLKTGWNDYTSYLTSTNMKQIGVDVMTGLNNGLSSMGKTIRETVSGIASGIAEWTSKALKVKSPSRVMFDIGEWTGIGLADGIASTKARNEAVMKDLGAVIAKVAKDNAADVTVIARNAEAERTDIQKDGVAKAKEITTKARQDIADIEAKASANNRKVTASESIRIQAIWRDAEAAQVKNTQAHHAKLAVVNSKAWADMVKREGEAAKERLDAIKQFIDDKKSLEQLSLVDEANIWRKAAESFKDGTKEKISAQMQYRDALAMVNTEITSINEAYASKQSAINDKLRADETALTKTYQDSLQSRMSALLSFAGIFDEFDAKVTKSGADLLANLNSQVNGFKTWQSEITTLSGKAIDDGLLAELQAMGPKALPELMALNSMTSDQLTQYSALYREKAALARKQAETELVGMKADTAKQITALRATANTELSLLQTEWVTKIKGVTQATSNEFKTLTEIGKTAGQNLLDGLKSMESSLVSQATAIAQAVNGALQTTLGGSVNVAGYKTPATSAGVSRTASAPTNASASGGTTYTGPVSVVIDAKTVTEFNNVVDFMQALPQQMRKR